MTATRHTMPPLPGTNRRRYPISKPEDVKNAVRATGRTDPAKRPAVRRHVIAQAKRLGCSHLIPDTWNSDGTLSMSLRVPAGQLLSLAERDPANRDAYLELAGKWRHGWIPLDAVAAAIKAKRAHGGGRGGLAKSRIDVHAHTDRVAALTSGARSKSAPRVRNPHPGGLVGPKGPAGQHSLTLVGGVQPHEAVRMKRSELEQHAAAGSHVARVELKRRADKRAAMKPATDRAQQVAQDRHRANEAKRAEPQTFTRDELRSASMGTDGDLKRQHAFAVEHGQVEHVTRTHAELEKRGYTLSGGKWTRGIAPTTTAHDLGNNETHSTGVSEHSGTFTALTHSQSKMFKTRQGAERWLAARGYNPDGTRGGTPHIPPTAALKAARKPSAVHQDYMRERHAQDMRFEAHTGGGISAKDTGTQEYKDYFGLAGGSGRPVETRLTYKEHLSQRRADPQDKANMAAYDAGMKHGIAHGLAGTSPSDAEYNAASKGHSDEHFGSGFTDGVIAGSAKREKSRPNLASGAATHAATGSTHPAVAAALKELPGPRRTPDGLHVVHKPEHDGHGKVAQVSHKSASTPEPRSYEQILASKHPETQRILREAERKGNLMSRETSAREHFSESHGGMDSMHLQGGTGLFSGNRMAPFSAGRHEAVAAEHVKPGDHKVYNTGSVTRVTKVTTQGSKVTHHEHPIDLEGKPSGEVHTRDYRAGSRVAIGARAGEYNPSHGSATMSRYSTKYLQSIIDSPRASASSKRIAQQVLDARKAAK